jgi:GH24 family phage-related lysozyme (muramidase)
MKISQEGLALIKRWEGCKLTSYQDSVGVWTIGYGITTNAGLGVIKKGMTITQKQADEWLLVALAKYEKTVQDSIKRPITQPQYDAMVSLCYNIGQGAFAKSSVVRKFNAGDTTEAADAFLMWVKAGGVTLKGLENRRKDERKHFLKAGKPVESPQKPVQPVPAPDVPTPPPVQPKPPLTIGQVMAYIVAGIIAIVGAYLGFGQ